MPQYCDGCGRYAASIRVPHRLLGCFLSRAREEEYLDLNDNGRKLCSKCSSIAIMDPKECKPLLQKVIEFYRNLDLEVDEDIPYFLVDSVTLLKFFPEKVGTIGAYLHRTGDSCDFVRIKQCLKGEGKVEVQKETEVVKRPKKPSAVARRTISGIVVVLVLFGKPDVDTGATSAHEMMHAWLHLKCRGRSFDLEERVKEGICEVMAYMWMEWFCSNGFDSSYKTSKEAQYTRDLKDHLAHKMERSKSIAYGQGFRDGIKAVAKFGLTTTLDHIVKEGSLPC